MTTGRTPTLDYLKSLVVAGTNKGHFYDLRSGSLADMWGTLNLTPNGGARLQRNGGATSVLNADYFSTGDTSLNTTTGLSFGIMMIPLLEGSAATLRLLNNGNTGATRFLAEYAKATGTISTSIAYNTGVQTTVASGAGSVAKGKRSLVCVSARDDADGMRVYVDGSPIPHANKNTAGLTIVAPTTGIRFPFVSATESATQQTYIYFEINKYLTAAEHAQLHDEIVNQIKYETNNLIINSTYPTIGSSVWEARYGLLAGEQTMSAGQDIGQLASLKVSTGTHKANTFLYNGVPAKGIKCVTAGDIILPDTIPDKGTTWVYRYYDDSAGTWATRTSASATVSLDAVNDLILWCDINSQNFMYKY
jgi:hypothetical protein